MFKTIASIIGFLFALPWLGMYYLSRAVFNEQAALTWTSESISLIPSPCGVYIRQAFYRCVLRSVGDDVYFGFMSLFSKPRAVIGHRVYIGRFCTIGYAQISDDVMIADGVQLLSGRYQHGRRQVNGQPLRDNKQEFKRIAIGRGAWIGAGAIIMADVGDDAIVGAGAVVIKPVAPGAKVVGVPAKPIPNNT